jgi:NAD(P)H-hydrate epimerase
VLTPHDGEYEALVGHRPDADRIEAARALASSSRCTVLLKGATTVVSAPDGEVLVVDRGDARLATAGTGDVLSGIIGALLACGLGPLRAAAAAAWVHGEAATLGPRRGLLAGDLTDLIPTVLGRLE